MSRMKSITMVALLTLVVPAWGAARVWIADQGDNQGSNNRILEIDPVNHKTPPDGEGDAIILRTVPSPAGVFLDELALDDNQQLWCVVKDTANQDVDGAKLINPDLNPGTVLRTIRPTFPNETLGGILEGLTFDGTGLWISAVRTNASANVLTRVSPVTGLQIAPFDSGPLGTAGKVTIPDTCAQGLLFEPPSAGRAYGYLWHSDVVSRKIYKLDIARLFDADPTNDNNLAVAVFSVPFGPKGMDWMADMIWVASPRDGIWEFNPATGAYRKLFNTPTWNIDGVAIFNPQGPLIRVSTHAISQSGWLAEDALPSSFTVRNVGIGTLDFTVSDDASWLSVAPTSGSSTGQAVTIAVNYTTAALPLGTYQATITVASTQAANSPQTVAVTLTVRTVKPDFDGDRDVDQEDFGVLQGCLSGLGGALPPACAVADLDGDGDVDQGDITIFLNCFSGPKVPAAHSCAN